MGDYTEPKTVEDWRDYDPANPSTHPADAAKVFVQTSKSQKEGPATFFVGKGFSLFNPPWGDHGEISRWRYQQW